MTLRMIWLMRIAIRITMTMKLKLSAPQISDQLKTRKLFLNVVGSPEFGIGNVNSGQNYFLSAH